VDAGEVEGLLEKIDGQVVTAVQKKKVGWKTVETTKEWMEDRLSARGDVSWRGR
jgi:hypothetical protein